MLQPILQSTLKHSGRGISGLSALSLLLLLLNPWSMALGQELAVRFSQSEYTAIPGAPFPVTVQLNGAIAAGLFSFGVKLVYDPQMGRVVDEASIQVPPQLDFNGVAGPAAFRAVGDGFAGVKGTVDALANPPQSYFGSVLAVFYLTGYSLGDDALRLEPFNTLGPSESIFVSGDGHVLDPFLHFEPAQLHFVPEPSSLYLLGLRGFAHYLMRRRPNS